MTTESQSQPEDESISLDVVIDVPEGVRPGVYANFVRVADTEHEFVLDFGVLPPPADLDRDEIRVTKKVHATPVVRVLVPIALLPRIIDALQERWQKHQSRLLEGMKLTEGE
jgi:hypothetical protein